MILLPKEDITLIKRMKHLAVAVQQKLQHGQNVGSNTPPKTNMEPQNWSFVDVSPFPRGYVQVPC